MYRSNMGAQFKEKLEAEINALEGKIWGTKAPADPDAAGQTAQGSRTHEEKSSPAATGSDSEYNTGSEKNFNTASHTEFSQEEPTTSDDQKVSYKTRFINLKKYHDAEIYKLRKLTGQLFDKINELEEDNRKLVKQLQETLKAKPRSIKDLATPEEIDRIGEDELAIFDKLLQNKLDESTKDLRERLSRAEAREAQLRKQQAQDAKSQAYTIFLEKLGVLVPDYAAIDVDPRFAKWLDQPDPYSGFIRMDLFKQAEASGDVGRVADFFREFKKSLGPAKTLDSKVTPVGSSASRTDKQQLRRDEQEIIPMSEYLKFMDDSTRGRYRGRESEERALMKRYDKALAERRIR